MEVILYGQNKFPSNTDSLHDLLGKRKHKTRSLITYQQNDNIWKLKAKIMEVILYGQNK